MRDENARALDFAPGSRLGRLVAANRRAATLKEVTRALKYLLVCLAMAAFSPLVACGQSAMPVPKPAPPADVETRVTPLKQQRELPRLLAPPPAYGNKIVMAQLAPPER
ncbi:MAG: hypothetical protein ABIQ16_18965 [Polyangiaceae bacterium]